MEPQETSLNKVLRISLVILIIAAVVLSGYIYLSTNQNKILPQVTPQVSPTSVVSPDLEASPSALVTATPSAVVTDSPVNVDIGSVDVDIKNIGVDVNDLQ